MLQEKQPGRRVHVYVCTKEKARGDNYFVLHLININRSLLEKTILLFTPVVYIPLSRQGTLWLWKK